MNIKSHFKTIALVVTVLAVVIVVAIMNNKTKISEPQAFNRTSSNALPNSLHANTNPTPSLNRDVASSEPSSIEKLNHKQGKLSMDDPNLYEGNHTEASILESIDNINNQLNY